MKSDLKWNVNLNISYDDPFPLIKDHVARQKSGAACSRIAQMKI